ncbi:FimV family protein, partial [Caldimonas sp.]|uniref:type IV pilus assembly protein FimV n=1 Tax=Caldimonas sp. TaxID=2838790 RepID=UPI003919AF3D
MTVQSALGEALRAEIDITSLTPEEAANLQARVAAPDAYRAAGVEYNAVLTGTRVTLERRPDGRPYLRVFSDRAVQEPFVDVILELSWTSGRLVREYTLLLDPPSSTRRAATPATAPIIGATPPAPLSPPAATPPATAARPAA